MSLLAILTEVPDVYLLLLYSLLIRCLKRTFM